MKLLVRSTFADYVEKGNATTEELLNSGSPFVKLIEEIYDFFPKVLWKDDVDMLPMQGLLSINALTLYLSAVRVGLTGHVAATYPLFRASLESSCYAYLMGQDPALEAVWSDRHKGEAERKACRKAFTSAVRDAAKSIAASQPTAAIEKYLNDTYELAVDSGAHPNPRSVLAHVGEPIDGGGHWHLPLVGLHGTDSRQIVVMLTRCLDFGMLIAIVLSHTTKGDRVGVAEELHRLNEAKELLESEFWRAG